jgi:hypothetical protein
VILTLGDEEELTEGVRQDILNKLAEMGWIHLEDDSAPALIEAGQQAYNKIQDGADVPELDAAATAGALAEGMDPESVGEAISLAANFLVLHDPGRRKENSSPGKPPGCVHGDSVGVHASDASNAWRIIARVGNPRNRVASLIVGAYHTAGQTDRVTKDPYPYADRLDQVEATDVESLISQAEEAIKTNDQARACGQLEFAIRMRGMLEK